MLPDEASPVGRLGQRSDADLAWETGPSGTDQFAARRLAEVRAI
jgi:hypothetical protein